MLLIGVGLLLEQLDNAAGRPVGTGTMWYLVTFYVMASLAILSRDADRPMRMRGKLAFAAFAVTLTIAAIVGRAWDP